MGLEINSGPGISGQLINPFSSHVILNGLTLSIMNINFSKDPNFWGVSFTSISAVGANAAVIHYMPTPTTDKELTTNEVYLLDSGGNYL